jgi:hypothetical protein
MLNSPLVLKITSDHLTTQYQLLCGPEFSNHVHQMKRKCHYFEHQATGPRSLVKHQLQGRIILARVSNPKGKTDLTELLSLLVNGQHLKHDVTYSRCNNRFRYSRESIQNAPFSGHNEFPCSFSCGFNLDVERSSNAQPLFPVSRNQPQSPRRGLALELVSATLYPWNGPRKRVSLAKMIAPRDILSGYG